MESARRACPDGERHVVRLRMRGCTRSLHQRTNPFCPAICRPRDKKAVMGTISPHRLGAADRPLIRPQRRQSGRSAMRRNDNGRTLRHDQSPPAVKIKFSAALPIAWRRIWAGRVWRKPAPVGAAYSCPADFFQNGHAGTKKASRIWDAWATGGNSQLPDHALEAPAPPLAAPAHASKPQKTRQRRS